MSEAQKILQMIEGVDPNDEDALNEIDANVYVFLRLYDDFNFSIHKGGKSVTYRHNSWDTKEQSVLYHLFDNHRYTRSRDALKAIRPEGWYFSTIYPADFTSAWCRAENGVHLLKSGYLPTEELAELHAIIQAIEWERSE